MTVTAMVAHRYKGTACGFGYIFVKLASFVTLFLFPCAVAATGTGAATAIVSFIALGGFLARSATSCRRFTATWNRRA